jgi:acyl-CoA synthetase (AMP-forming)/AMP-acid ligase II
LTARQAFDPLLRVEIESFSQLLGKRRVPTGEERLRVTHPYLVPTMYVRLLRLPEDVRNKYDLSSVKFVSSTGAPCAPDVKRAMIDWWGDVINETYASSETGYLTAISSAEARRKPGSAGQPIEGVSIKIVDDDGNEVPAGVTGKIYARHFATPLFTYINREGDRKAIERDGYVTVGDIGYLDDEGYLYVCDRRTDLVLSGGVNIYPAEIEQVLIGMPGVADCAVMGIDGGAGDRGGDLAVHLETTGTGPILSRLIVVGEQHNDANSFSLLRLGVKGLLTYVEARDQLVRALPLVANGGFWVPRQLLSGFVDSILTSQGRRLKTDSVTNLSRREQEVLDSLLENLSNKEIAWRLQISESYVKAILQSLFQKTGVRTRGQLVRVAVEQYEDQL